VFLALHEYRQKSAVVRNSLALSVLNQALTCCAFYLAFRATGVTDLRMSQFFLIVPLGLVTSAVPISPAGIGVGQAAFFALFRIVAPSYASAGTDAFTVFQAIYILLCLSGLFWYVAYKHNDAAGRAW
jgi:glycosyltransferase 2 family protein